MIDRRSSSPPSTMKLDDITARLRTRLNQHEARLGLAPPASTPPLAPAVLAATIKAQNDARESRQGVPDEIQNAMIEIDLAFDRIRTEITAGNNQRALEYTSLLQSVIRETVTTASTSGPTRQQRATLHETLATLRDAISSMEEQRTGSHGLVPERQRR